MKRIITTVAIIFFAFRLTASINVYPPSLLSPANDALNQMPNVLLNWAPVTGGFGLGYHVQIDTDNNFTNPINLSISSSAINASELLFGESFFWRVRAFDNTDTSGWSVIRSFTIISKVNMIPLTSNTWECYQKNQSLNWQSISGLTKYTYQLDTIASFTSSFLITDTILPAVQSFSFSSIPYTNTVYYFRIKAAHSQDESLWSEVISFQMCNSMPNTPKLNLPLNSTINEPIATNLDWIPLTDADSYIIQYDTNSSFSSATEISFKPVTTNIMALNNSRFNVTGLDNNTTYFWRVKAVKNTESSLWSETWAFTTVDTMPSVPSLIHPEDLSTHIHPSVQLEWGTVNIGGSTYLIEIDTDPLFATPDTIDTSNNNATVNELLFGTTYFWRAKAVSGSNYSDWSVARSFTTLEYTTMAGPVDNSIGSILNTSFSWENISGVTSFNLQIDTTISFNSNLFIDTVINGSLNAINLTASLYNTDYFWRLKTMHASDTSLWSSVWTFATVDTMPSAPELLLPIDMSLDLHPHIQLEWTDVVGATSYIVEYDTDVLFITPDTLTSVTNNIDLVDLFFDTTYFWRVKALGADTSNWSTIFSFSTIDVPILTIPVLSAMYQMPDVTLEWEAINGATEYVIEYDTDITFSNPILAYSNLATYKTNDLQFNGDYYWRVKAITLTDTSNWSDVYTFKVIETINQLLPLDGAVTEMGVLFTWETISGVLGYECQIDTTTDFNSTLLNVINTGINTPVQAFSLQNLFGTTYYWRVRSMHANDTSAWSSIRYFEITNNVELAMPLNASIDIMPNTKLSSYNIYGLSNYQFEIDTVPTFDSFLYSLSYPTSNVPYVQSQTSELYFGTTYYWRARGRKGSVFTNWSDTWSFTTIDKVNLVSPVDSSSHQNINLKLIWNPISGITKYVVELDTVPGFTSPSSYDVLASSAEIQLPSSTFSTKTYYWRVKAVHSSDETQWSDTWSFNYTYNVGIENINHKNSFALYPNPSKGLINIELTMDNPGNVNMYILDITGRTVYSENLSFVKGLNSKQINLGFLSQGIYIINFKNDNLNLNRKLILNN